MTRTSEAEADFGCLVVSDDHRTGYIFSHYSFLFAEAGHRPHGKLLYIERQPALRGHPVRLIEGRPVTEVKSHSSAEGLRVVPDDELARISLRAMPRLVRRHTHPFGANYVSVPASSLRAIISPRQQYCLLRSRSGLIEKVTDYISRTTGISLDDLGITGSSLITGAPSANDHDIVVYCDPPDIDRLNAAVTRIRRAHERRAPAFGIDWPYRFIHPQFGTICLFVAYKTRAACPISLRRYRVIEKSVAFTGVIEADQLAAYSPSIYHFDSAKYPWLIFLGTALRGMYRSGTRIDGRGSSVRVLMNGVPSNAIVVAFPFDQINGMKLRPERGPEVQ